MSAEGLSLLTMLFISLLLSGIFLEWWTPFLVIGTITGVFLVYGLIVYFWHALGFPLE
jgi:hypothetical protein